MSPLPWRIEIEPYFHIRAADGDSVFAQGICREDDGTYLIRAVNSHADLLAALEKYVEHFGDPLKCACTAIAKAKGLPCEIANAGGGNASRL